MSSLLRRLKSLFVPPVFALAGAAQPSADDHFGVMTHYAQGWDIRSIPMVAQAGVSGVRDELYWREVERERGVFTFPESYDRYMSTLARHGVAPLVILSFENDLYDGGATPHTDEGIAAYAQYGAAVLRRYGEQIKAVEIWNEYNGGFARGPATADRAGTYLRMLRSAHEGLKRTRPDVQVVGGATAGVPLPYWEKLMAGGGLASMDVLSVHPYRYDFPPEGIETDIAELAALVAKYNNGRPKPIWVTEIGWQTQESTAPGDVAIDERVQAQYLVRAYALLLSAGVERVYWYLLHDYANFSMGLLRADGPLTPKPGLAAMAHMIRELGEARFIERDRTPLDLYSLRFRQPGGDDVRVMWSLRPRTLRVSGVTRAMDLTGQPLADTGELRLDEAPVFVTGAVQGFPTADETVVATARLGFSGAQGANGWSYGYVRTTANEFIPLPTFGADDWRYAWFGVAPYLWVTAADQHPSVLEGVPVASVRRWRSERADTVRVFGRFFGGKYGGDGVGVGVVVDGKPRLNKILGGGDGRAVAEEFDFVEEVTPGTTIDFFVNPGPAANIDHDATAVTITVASKEEKR